MCGIAGYTGPAHPELTDRMRRSLDHRGPDEHGVFEDGNINLCHTRLSVVDLKTGRQPLFNEDGSLAIVFNGEIYNYRELRQSIEPRHRFTTSTDTEVILHLYEELGHGVTGKLRGDYAFAIWDGRDRSLFLSRDPAGVKPLFYTQLSTGDLVFASELRTLLQDVRVSREPDLAAVAGYLRGLYFDAPETIYRGTFKLGPGESLVWKNGSVRRWKHWSVPVVDTSLDEHEARERTSHLLEQSVRRRLIADVPVGAFLSGGLDSSLIVAAASRHVSQMHTFCLGFGDPDFDEVRYAREVSARFGTTHHEFVVNPRPAELAAEVIQAMDEPMADSSAMATFLVAKATRSVVKVALSGIGGDELFFGYPRYAGVQISENAPGFLLRAAAAAGKFFPSRPAGRDVGGWIRRFGGAALLPFPERYLRWMRHCDVPTLRDLLGDHFGSIPSDDRLLSRLSAPGGSVLDRVSRADIESYLASNLLPLADTMTMAHGLEVRVPFCDEDLIAGLTAVPAHVRLPGLTLKPLLRQLARERLPRRIARRPKLGFMVPLGKWFRGPLREYLISNLTTSGLPGFIEKRVAVKLAEEHVSGSANHTHLLWALVVLNQWIRKYQ